MRRARRLLPALAAMVVVYAGWATLNGRLPAKTIALAALYCGNAVQAFTNPNPLIDRGLDHLWSLAEEEQFYLVWLLLLTLIVRRRRSAAYAAALLLPLLAYRTGILIAGARPDRVYRGPDTHLVGPMGGSLLAIVSARRPVRVGAASHRSHCWGSLESRCLVPLMAVVPPGTLRAAGH